MVFLFPSFSFFLLNNLLRFGAASLSEPPGLFSLSRLSEGGSPDKRDSAREFLQRNSRR